MRVTALAKRPGDVVAGRVDAADQLDDDVAGGEDLVEVPLLAAEDAGHLGAAAGDLGDHLCPIGEQLLERCADRPFAEDADGYLSGLGLLRRHRLDG